MADQVLCAACSDLIEPVASALLRVTRTEKMDVVAIGAYRDPLKFLILAKSWGDRTAATQLATLIWHKTTLQNRSFDLIVPVPLHWRRQLTRGFNQAELMAQRLSALSGKPVVKLVKRVQSTQFQSALYGAAHRKANVHQVFALDERLIDATRDKHILLIDDLMTTGATLQEIGKVLLKAKPLSITAAVGARVCF